MTRTPIDPYATLRVGRGASPAQVARAYHRLAKELHPDLRGDATGDRMREVNAAWEILSDPDKRAAWDRGQPVVAAGAHWTPASAGVRSDSVGSSTEWAPERRPRRYAAYPPRPRPGERRLTDSPWLAGAVALAAIVAILVGAGIFSVGDRRTLADRFEGFQAQVPVPFLNRAVAGTAIRLSFGLGGFEGYDLLADGSPASRYYPCENGAPGPADVQAAVDATSSSFAYYPTNHSYTYIWKTEASWAGSCRELIFTFRDASSRRVLFDFRGPLP